MQEETATGRGKRGRGKKQDPTTTTPQEAQKIEAAPKKKTPEVPYPAVFRNRGYYFITLYAYAERVKYLDVAEGAILSATPEDFLSTYQHQPNESATRWALNLLCRAALGTFTSTMDVYRRLIEMASNREELLKLSDQQLAKEYNRICKPQSPLSLITEEYRDARIEEILAKLKEEQQLMNQSEAPQASADQSDGNAQPGDAGASASSESPGDDKKGVGIMAGKGGKKKGATGAAAKKKREASQVVIEAVTKDNPYREGTKKHKAFALYCKGGKRSTVIENIEKLGVTKSTATTWMGFFRSVVQTGKQPDWEKPRSKKEPKAAATAKKTAKKKSEKKK